MCVCVLCTRNHVVEDGPAILRLRLISDVVHTKYILQDAFEECAQMYKWLSESTLSRMASILSKVYRRRVQNAIYVQEDAIYTLTRTMWCTM